MFTFNADLEHLYAFLDKYLGYWDIANEYGEPGYLREREKNGIIFANWNNVPKRVADWCEKHFAIEWSDEWIVAWASSKAYRTNADCYDWKPYFWENDGEIIGGDEIENNEYIQEDYVNYLVNNPRAVNYFAFDLTKHGFELARSGCESGWFPGQTDNPKEILEKILEKNPDAEVIFGEYSLSQFYCQFSVWVRLPESESESEETSESE